MIPIYGRHHKLDVFDRFWQRYPALLYGLTLFIGASAALQPSPLWLMPVIGGGISLLGKSSYCRAFLASLLLLCSYLYVQTAYHFPPLETTASLEGTAQFHITSLKEKGSSFGKQWQYHVILASFIPHYSEKSILHHIPCLITLSNKTEVIRPLADTDYQVKGKLQKTKQGTYTLTVDKESLWYPIKGSWSLAEWRFQLKQSLSHHLYESFANRSCASFLNGIATGELTDKFLSFELGRFGLQHIVAVSGFHFTVLAGLLSFFLRLFLPWKWSLCLCFLLLTGYFFFLGCSASILRAWISVSLFLAGPILEQRTRALNCLGVGLMVIAFIDPLLYTTLGFQLSFVATAAILLLYRPIDRLLQQLLKKRKLSEVIEMSLLNQHAYMLLSWFRDAAALTLAVHLVTLPLIMLYFFKFPWMSLLYNLFFPFLVGFSMFLLAIGLISMLVAPPLGMLIHTFNNSYTQIVLNLVLDTSTTLDYCWRSQSFSVEGVALFLCLIFFLAAMYHIPNEE